MVSTKPATSDELVTVVGRQPIFTGEMEVYGYELLYRSMDELQRCVIDDGDYATASVILHSIVDVGWQRLVGERLAFLNMTRNLLMAPVTELLAPDRFVLEILENVKPDEQLLEHAQKLKDAGFTLALDDYSGQPELEPWLDMVQLVKIDLIDVQRDNALIDIVARLKDHDVQILAEKVETSEEFRQCLDLECDFFQGYFFSRPENCVGQKTMETNSSCAIQLFAKLQDPFVTVDEIEALIRTAPELSYRVLRIANSPLYISAFHQIESLSHAITMLGLRRVRALASALVFGQQAHKKPKEIFTVAMIRANMCEQLGEAMRMDCPDRMFALGLVSAFDAVLDMPLQDIVKSLSLAEDLNHALLTRTGTMGNILGCVIDRERGIDSTQQLGIDPCIANRAYMRAIAWADECTRVMV